jgi:hypothetical protein
MKVEIDELLHQEFETIVLDPAGRKMEETVI